MIKVEWKKNLNHDPLSLVPICNWIDLGNGTMFRLIAFFTYTFNDMPRDGLFVGLERIGCFLFPVDKFIHWEYVSDKLFIPESDARVLADWMNVQMDHKVEQQGEYSRRYIEECDIYFIAGERPQMPIQPFIIEE